MRKQYQNLVDALRTIREAEGRRSRKLKKAIVRWAAAMGQSIAMNFSHMHWWINQMSDPEYVPNAADEAIMRYAEIYRKRNPHKKTWRNY